MNTKEVKRVLEKQQLWPVKGFNLECFKPKYFNCQIAADCKICVKSHKCDLCNVHRNHSVPNCSKNWQCNFYSFREEHCQRDSKKYCATSSIKKGKCADFEHLPLKYTSDGYS